MTFALFNTGTWLGRAMLPGFDYPRIVTVRQGVVVDITAPGRAMVRDIVESGRAAALVGAAEGTEICRVEDMLAVETASGRNAPRLLSPIDLQAIKAAGVTFAVSMLERVIEEHAQGDKNRAYALRTDISRVIGTEISDLVPGSDAAATLKTVLVGKGLWSQYLEVGIGPDAEIFTKAQPMSSVGHLAEVGLHPMSRWNNPEPEIVVVVSSAGEIVGATLGNDVNLRDIEGRSALLLGKAKDNNASAAIGPFIRLFDDIFTVETVKCEEVTLRIEGQDGFSLDGTSSMTQISRTPEALVGHTIGDHHQYPDGFVLYLGTMFAPTQDRGTAGSGFTHKIGDAVTISAPSLGVLVNRVNLSTQCPPWTYAASHLLRDLARHELL